MDRRTSSRSPRGDGGREARRGREDQRHHVPGSTAVATRIFCWRFAIHGVKQCELRPTYDLREVRIGEASHPGPSAKRRRRVRSSRGRDCECGPDPTLLDDLERDLAVSVDASSEDEPLIRPNNGRRFVPRMKERMHEEVPDRDTECKSQTAILARQSQQVHELSSQQGWVPSCRAGTVSVRTFRCHADCTAHSADRVLTKCPRPNDHHRQDVNHPQRATLHIFRECLGPLHIPSHETLQGEMTSNQLHDPS